MSLNALFDIQKSLIPTTQVTVKLDADLVAYAEHLAEELELTRSDVMRVAFRDGMRSLWGQWEQACEDGKKRLEESPYVKSKKESKK